MAKINIFNIESPDLACLLMVDYEQDLNLSKKETQHLIKIILEGDHTCLFELVGILTSNTPQSKNISTELADTILDMIITPYHLEYDQKDLVKLYRESKVLTDAQKQKILEALKQFIVGTAEETLKNLLNGDYND